MGNYIDNFCDATSLWLVLNAVHTVNVFPCSLSSCYNVVFYCFFFFFFLLFFFFFFWGGIFLSISL